MNNININIDNNTRRKSNKSWVLTLILAILFGGVGIHRFYVNKAGTGIIWFLTGGLLGVGWIIDIIMILCKSFKDGYGNIID